MSPKLASAPDLTWSCGECPHRHQPGTPCPPEGVWLVLRGCPRCDERRERYCTRHANPAVWRA